MASTYLRSNTTSSRGVRFDQSSCRSGALDGSLFLGVERTFLPVARAPPTRICGFVSWPQGGRNLRVFLSTLAMASVDMLNILAPLWLLALASRLPACHAYSYAITCDCIALKNATNNLAERSEDLAHNVIQTSTPEFILQENTEVWRGVGSVGWFVQAAR